MCNKTKIENQGSLLTEQNARIRQYSDQCKNFEKKRKVINSKTVGKKQIRQCGFELFFTATVQSLE